MVLDHRIQDDQQLAHAGGEGHFLGLACCQEPLIEGGKDWIVADGDQGRHIQSRAHVGTPSPTGSLPAELATVPAERGYANESGDLPAVECAQFGEAGQQGEGQGWADARYAAQQVFPLLRAQFRKAALDVFRGGTPPLAGDEKREAPEIGAEEYFDEAGEKRDEKTERRHRPPQGNRLPNGNFTSSHALEYQFLAALAVPGFRPMI